jgi:putative solute:sodium symporter small subunit
MIPEASVPPPAPMPVAADEPFEVSEYWRQTRRLTWQLLLLWLVLTFASIFFARDLTALRFFGWPLSFYMVAQGMVLVYTAIIAFYAYKMKQLDRRFGRSANRHNNQQGNPQTNHGEKNVD